MNQLSKVLVTIGVVIVFVLVFGLFSGYRDSVGQTPGILGLIMFGALIGALRAIWKKPKDGDDDNTSILQK